MKAARRILAHLWIRAETDPSEKRTPLIPLDAEILIESGFSVTVESSKQRVFSDEEYSKVGCQIVEPGSWKNSFPDTFVLGLKELPESDAPISQHHIFFAHAYRGQPGAEKLLKRFVAGGGVLLDPEYVVNSQGKRLVGSRYEAGLVGAALAMWAWGNYVLKKSSLLPPLHAYASTDALKKQMTKVVEKVVRKAIVPKVLITGARGATGIGAVDLVTSLGIRPTLWNREETAEGGPFPEILSFDILIHCVGIHEKTAPFLDHSLISSIPDRNLAIISDVACDIGNPFHVLPIIRTLTSFEKPILSIAQNPRLDVIAINRLPTLVPVESSELISSQLTPLLGQLPKLKGNVWEFAHKKFLTAVGSLVSSSIKRG